MLIDLEDSPLIFSIGIAAITLRADIVIYSPLLGHVTILDLTCSCHILGCAGLLIYIFTSSVEDFDGEEVRSHLYEMFICDMAVIKL